MRALLVVAVGSVALVVAGCGSSSATTTPETSLAPSDVGAFVVIDTDQSATQWKNAQTLLAKIPGGEKALDGALSQLGGAKGLDFKSDVAPAFGKQLIIVVPSGARNPILLVRPDDPKKLDALLAKDTKPHVTGDVSGWTAVAMTQKELDSYNAALAKGTLSDQVAYAKATEGLPAESLAYGYVSGPGLANVLGAASGATQSLTGSSVAGLAGSSRDAANQIGTIGFAISATDRAFRIDGSVEAKSGVTPASYTPTLLARVPADALVAVSFDGAGQGQKTINQALQKGGSQLGAIEKQLGVKLGDLAAALDGEGVLYVRAGAPIPEITLLIKPKDAKRAGATFRQVSTKLAGSGGASDLLPGLGVVVRTTVGGVVVVSTSENAASELDSGPKLVATDRFKTAAKEVGFSGKTSGLGYVDVHALGPLLKTALGALGGSASSSTTSGLEGLAAFDTAVFGATADGLRTRFAVVINLS